MNTQLSYSQIHRGGELLNPPNSIHKIEYIRFEHFIPNWTEMIKEMDEKKIKYGRSKYALSNGLSFGDSKTCLVGESYFGDTGYIKSCFICNHLHYTPALFALNEGGKTFQDFKLNLYTHFLESHTELMIR